MVKMNRYFYTFGTSEQFPYQRGWVEVHAYDWEKAHAKFRSKFPDRHKKFKCLNCSDYYTEEWFLESDMFKNGNLGEFCHEIIE